MSAKSFFQLAAILAIFLSPLACSIPGMTTVVPTESGPGNVETYAVQLTLTSLVGGGPAGATTVVPPAQGEPTFTPTSSPTMTSTPTFTPTITETPTYTVSPSVTNTPTNTVNPTPCNAATFVTDVTIPDNTEFTVNKEFVKTWRLKNVGTCTWTSGYRLIFDHGDQMGAAASVAFTGGTVTPGNSIDISVSLKAPAVEGTYQGWFRLKSSDGQIFGIGSNASNPFWVKIKAYALVFHIIPTLDFHLFLKPDLEISSITIDPNPAKSDVAAHIHVKVTNSGGDSGGFVVKWWGLDTFASPSCSWNVASLSQNTSKTLQCDFTYPSPYGPHQSKATADTGGVINESDEGNNTRKVGISVSP